MRAPSNLDRSMRAHSLPRLGHSSCLQKQFINNLQSGYLIRVRTFSSNLANVSPIEDA
jgi:hypothetical protein